MYGFRLDSIYDTGYLKMSAEGKYTVVKDRKNALRLDIKNKKDLAGWNKFFNEEDDLKQWKFHAIELFEEGENSDEETVLRNAAHVQREV